MNKTEDRKEEEKSKAGDWKNVPSSLTSVAFIGRTFEEYKQMFCIDNTEDLKIGKTLDVASGHNSFISECLKQGIDVIGCDPMYSKDADELCKIGIDDMEKVYDFIIEAHTILHIPDLETFCTNVEKAREIFKTDYQLHRERYICASLPNLPFGDREFDNVLTSFCLIIYSPIKDGGIMPTNTFDLEFHLKSIDELARVCKHQIRMYPMQVFSGESKYHVYVKPIIDRLENLGFKVELLPSIYKDGAISDKHALVATRARVS